VSSTTITVASSGAGTHEVVQVLIPDDWSGPGMLDTAALRLAADDYEDRHGRRPDGRQILTTERTDPGLVFTVLVYARDREDPS
jgi:hypothetical protein